MKQTNKVVSRKSLLETMIYVVGWLVVLLSPIISNLFDVLSDNITDITEMQWRSIFLFWLNALPFFLLFMLNNFCFAPLLFKKSNVRLYIAAVVLSAAAIFTVVGLTMPVGREERVRTEQRMHQIDTERLDMRYFIFDYSPYQGRTAHLIRFRGPFLGRMLLALLMCSFNIAVKQFLKSMHDQEVMQELERNNLQSELKYLKYQINPHFFMNTLNNIHALVDIDAEKAKQMLMELSKLMRYVLYEANKRTIQLSKEVQFLNHYVALMRIRYTDDVKITADFTFGLREVYVPPLLFVSLVENAFKHGISYQQHSYVDCRLNVEEENVVFRCDNSKQQPLRNTDTPDRTHIGGIGLENIRKRLHLLYGERYELTIQDTADSYKVKLSVPVS
ncbi:MAG: histidine kinase [Prevotellaceae bacterium]|jgi:two-component sensor histidine kinase|nr:histidine kinase [Prevotellaceae bacterium]